MLPIPLALVPMRMAQFFGRLIFFILFFIIFLKFPHSRLHAVRLKGENREAIWAVENIALRQIVPSVRYPIS